MNKPLYFCIGCRQVHNDNDYCKEDGDLLIPDWYIFLKSVEIINKSQEKQELLNSLGEKEQ